WVSIQSQSAVACAVWWLTSGTGDGTSLLDTGGGPTVEAFDLSLCLTPAECNNDGFCDAGENSCNCEADCGACEGTCVSGACCGDGVVEGHEECDFAGCGTCPWDTFPVDGDVGAGDLAFLLGNWGPIPKGADQAILCLDAEPDGDIGAFDLANVLGNWGPCPVGFGEDLCVEDDCDASCECVGRGACCDVKGPGTCDELLTADECAIAGGNYVGDDTTCANCPHPACANADGDCCDPNGTPGCDDPDCCAAVCELAPICCDEGWDSLCAGLATDVCAGGCPIPLDDCASPGTITDGDTSYDTTGAITDGLLHAGCQFDGQTYHDIWFNYDATCTGDLTVTTCEDDGGSAVYDTDLVVYDGCFPDIPCPPTDADLLGCNDDNCSVGFHSSLQVAVVLNDCYTIRVGGWQDGDQGPGVLHLNCVQGTVCGDLVCEGDETSCSCPADCPGECPCFIFTNQADFEAFNEANGKTLKGVEDFEEGILGAGAVDGMDDPLCGGVPNAPDAFPYPAGLTQLNMCVQGNTLAGNATDPSPTGIDGLAAASAGFFGASSDIVVANFFADSLDIMLTSPPVLEGEEDDHTAVGFNTLGNLIQGPGTVDIQVYSKANVLLLSASSPSDAAGSNFWGVSCTEPIGRINIFDPVNGSGGADNIQLWEFAGTCGEFGCEDAQGENTCNCPADCGPDTCGNGICCASAGEDCAGCPEDCGDCPSCGDGNCDANEDCASCDADCGVCVGCDICYTNCDDLTGPGAPCIDNGADDWMSNVTFAGINNTTGTEGCPCSYGNHSALQASVVAGQTYDLTISICSDGTWVQHGRAWFDWNGNLDYECDESVYLGSGIDATLTAPVTVPAGTPAGCYSMRVLEQWSTDPGCGAACTGGTFGEVEDYTVCVE
ncbi:MAG: hypothetical protein IIA66_12555, partial [Planctomycetes bacterium]|nr:hypothetical protein [Planctomycetota bacterium]